jgi:hypothetical protein
MMGFAPLVGFGISYQLVLGSGLTRALPCLKSFGVVLYDQFPAPGKVLAFDSVNHSAVEFQTVGDVALKGLLFSWLHCQRVLLYNLEKPEIKIL